jgi:hypothetical protein
LMLMKKHDAINYHAVREAVAAGIFWESERRTAKRIWQMYWQRWLCDKRDGIFVFIYFVELLIQPIAKGSHWWLALSGKPPGIDHRIGGFIILCHIWCSNSSCQVAS